MAWRTSYLVVWLFLWMPSPQVAFAGRYVYDENTGVFHEKSKKEAYRVKVVRKSSAKEGKSSHDKRNDPRWSPFYQRQHENDNLDLWLNHFLVQLAADLAALDETPVGEKQRLDFIVRRGLLARKLTELQEELARPRMNRRFWQQSPTDVSTRLQEQAYDAKLQLYEELKGNAFSAQVDAQVDGTVLFFADLRNRNNQEQQLLQSLPADVSLTALRELDAKIAVNHNLILRLSRNVLAAVHDLSQSAQVLIDEEYDEICETYGAITQHHQELYNAIHARVATERERLKRAEELAQQIQVEEESRPSHQFSWHLVGDKIAAGTHYLGRSAVGLGRLAIVPVALGALEIQAGYQRARRSYQAHNQRRQENLARHQAFCAQVENDWASLIPDNVLVDEHAIYQRELVKLTQPKYRYREVNFAAYATASAFIQAQQARSMRELRSHLSALNDNDAFSNRVREKIRKELAKSLRIIRQHPEQSTQENHRPQAIEERVCAKEANRIAKRLEEAAERQRIIDGKVNKANAQRNRKEQTRSRARDARIQARDYRAQKRGERQLIRQQNSAARAQYRLIKARLLTAYHRRAQSNDSELDRWLLEILIRAHRQKIYGADYQAIFGNRSLEKIVSAINKATYEEFWPELCQMYRSKVENLKERQARQQQEHELQREQNARKAAYRESNWQALQSYVQKISNDEELRDVTETMLWLCWEQVTSNTQHDVFRGHNLTSLLESHDSFDGFVTQLSTISAARVAELMKFRVAERQRASRKSDNLRALRERVGEIKQKQDAERNTIELLLVLFKQNLDPKRRTAIGKRTIFANHDLHTLLESSDSFDDFVQAISAHFKDKAIELQTKKDEKLLLRSAKKGLSKKGVGTFRERTLRKLSNNLDAIDAEYTSPNEDPPPLKQHAFSREKRVRSAFKEILARQDEFDQTLKLVAAQNQMASQPDGDYGDEDDGVAECDDDILEITEQNAFEEFKNWYEDFPNSIAIPIQITETCSLCFGEVDYELTFSTPDHANITQGKLLQQPKVGTHKLSICGHMLCATCMRDLEANAKKIKTKVALGECILSPYACPWCSKKIPCDELNPQKFKRAFGQGFCNSNRSESDCEQDIVSVE